MLACHGIDIAPGNDYFCYLYSSGIIDSKADGVHAWPRFTSWEVRSTDQSVFQSLSGLAHVPLIVNLCPLLEV